MRGNAHAFRAHLIRVCASFTPRLRLAMCLHTLTILGCVCAFSTGSAVCVGRLRIAAESVLRCTAKDAGLLETAVYIPHFVPPQPLGGAIKTLHNSRIRNTKTCADFLAARYTCAKYHARPRRPSEVSCGDVFIALNRLEVRM